MAFKIRHPGRKLLGLMLAGSIGWSIWVISRIDKPEVVEMEEQHAEPGQLPATPQEEMGCSDDIVFDWDGDRLEAGRACKRPDGWLQLERVALHVRNEDGSPKMVVRGDRGRAASDEGGGPTELLGNVLVETPDGLKLEGEVLVIDRKGDQVRSERAIRFTRGDLSGSGGRLVHDIRLGRTHLEDGPELKLTGERTQGREVTLVGQALDYDQEARRLVAAGAALLEYPEGSVEADRIEVALAEDKEEVRLITATGSAASKTVLAGAAGGPVVERVLRAQRIAHAFAGGGALDSIEADGGATLTGRSIDASAGITESLEGARLKLDFESGAAATLAGIEASGAPARFSRADPTASRTVVGNELRLSAEGGQVRRLVVTGAADVRDETSALTRTLRADSADMTFAPGGLSLDALVFDGKPGRLQETPKGAGAPRTVAARKGDLTFDAQGNPKGGTLQGQVEIVSATSRASADSATILASPQRTVLKGNAAVERDGRTSHGDEITIEEKGALTVKGNQHTLVRDSSGIPGMASTGGDEPVLISSESLVLKEAQRTALYDGGRPSLRRGDTELVADRLAFDDAAGALDAIGSVTSRLRLAKPGAASEASESPFDPTRLVDGRAREFHYRRGERRVTYLGDVTLEQEDTVLTAQRVDIFLTAGQPAEVESLEASGGVLFKAPSRGQAEGERLRWRKADESFLVYAGSRPARAVDADGNFQTGAVVQMTRRGVAALASPTGRARGSSPALQPQDGGTPVVQAPTP